MATIKDVAKLSGVSVTTVSIIANGKSEERKISAATCQKVREAMRQLGYQPNLSARRLRYQDSTKPSIAFFWPLDYRTSILASFLNAFQREIQESGFACELVVQTYENDHLDQYDGAILRNGYSGIVVGACSIKDLKHLEELSPQMPLVLINRESQLFSTVCTDNKAVGLTAATQIRQRGYTEAAVFSTQHSYVATGLRVQAFLDACSQIGLQVLPEHILKGPASIQGGFQVGEAYCQLPDPPKIIFCDSDSLALGALRSFYNHQLRVPEDVELLTISMLDPEHTAYSIPSLSVIEMPNQEIGKAVIRLLQEKITTSSLEPDHIFLDASLIMRESFRGTP